MQIEDSVAGEVMAKKAAVVTQETLDAKTAIVLMNCETSLENSP